MLDKFYRIQKHTLLAATLLISTACTFEGVPGITPESVSARWNRASLSVPYDSNRYTLASDRNFEVQHGASCAEASSAVSQDNVGRTVYGIRVDDKASIPAHYDAATVFLNGWRLIYSDQDHHVLALSTALTNIEINNNELSWSAGGIISDKNGDDGYYWCYHYTVMFWKQGSRNVRANVNDSDADASLTFLSMDNTDKSTAYKFDVNNLDDQPSRPKALLPRGFGAAFSGGDDNHLLQFSLKHGEPNTYAYDDGSGFGADWAFQTVLKDKKTHRNYYAAQLLSVMSGTDVSVTPQTFQIEAREPPNGSIGDRGVFSDTFVVDNVPYDYAVPMLTGWDLGSGRSDRHIKDIGAWIESFEYTKDPDDGLGILTYTVKSVFDDKSSVAISMPPTYQINILGMDRSSLYRDPAQVPDVLIEELESTPATPLVTTTLPGVVVKNPKEIKK